MDSLGGATEAQFLCNGHEMAKVAQFDHLRASNEARQNSVTGGHGADVGASRFELSSCGAISINRSSHPSRDLGRDSRNARGHGA